MVYRRVPPPPLPLSIWQFELDGEPDGSMVKIRFDNGDALYVARDNARAWRPDKRLMPQSLRDILAMDGDGFSLCRGLGGVRSGDVGSCLFLKIRAARVGWREDVVFISDGRITSIRPVQRPRDNRPTTLHGEVASWNRYMADSYARSVKARASK